MSEELKRAERSADERRQLYERLDAEAAFQDAVGISLFLASATATLLV